MPIPTRYRSRGGWRFSLLASPCTGDYAAMTRAVEEHSAVEGPAWSGLAQTGTGHQPTVETGPSQGEMSYVTDAASRPARARLAAASRSLSISLPGRPKSSCHRELARKVR